jgi:hypothetical protein
MGTMTRGSNSYFKYKGTFSSCTDEHWRLFYISVLADLPLTPGRFLSTLIDKGTPRDFLTTIIQNHRSYIEGGRVCGQCRKRMNNWSAEFSAELTAIKPFDTFLPLC